MDVRASIGRVARGGRPVVLLSAIFLALGAAGLTTTPADAATSPVMRSGQLAGPLDVRGGSRVATVASLGLGRGNWTVFAKGVLRNTTRDADAHPARCRLALRGSSDEVLASPFRRDRADSRQVFLLTHAAHLDTAASALLRCAAPGSATGDIVVEDVRMVAFRTAALGVEHELGSEVFYGDADAISQVRLLIGNDALVPGEIRNVATLALPAGRWAITAKATVLQSSDDFGSLRCIVSVGTDGGASYALVGAPNEPGDRMPIALELVHSDDESFEARLECQDLTDHGTTGIRDIRLVAYRARAIASQVLDPGATYGPFPESIRPVVYAGHDSASRQIPVSDGYRTINRMTLPAGRWVITATGVMTQSTAERPDVSCRVGRPGGYDEVQLRLGQGDAVTQAQPFALTWAGSFSAPRAVRFQCRSTGGAVAVYYFAMLAYKAGTLRILPLR